MLHSTSKPGLCGRIQGDNRTCRVLLSREPRSKVCRNAFLKTVRTPMASQESCGNCSISAGNRFLGDVFVYRQPICLYAVSLTADDMEQESVCDFQQGADPAETQKHRTWYRWEMTDCLSGEGAGELSR